MKLHLRATGCHLPYGITQCYLSPHRRPRLYSARQVDAHLLKERLLQQSISDVRVFVYVFWACVTVLKLKSLEPIKTKLG